MDFTKDLKGLRELDKTFARLPRAMQVKAYKQSLRKGAEIVRNAAQNNIRMVSDPYSGVLRRRGTVRVYNFRKYRGNFRAGVQIKRGLVNPAKRDGNGKPVRVGLYAAVLEYGSQKLNRRPRSWIRKAIREEKTPAVAAVAKEMNTRVDDAVREARK